MREQTYRFDVSMQKTHRVDALDGFQDLSTQPECGGDTEYAIAHVASQVCQVPSLQFNGQTSLQATEVRVVVLLRPV